MPPCSSYLHKPLQYPNKDDTSIMHSGCRRDQHIEGRGEQYCSPKDPGRQRWEDMGLSKTWTAQDSLGQLKWLRKTTTSFKVDILLTEENNSYVDCLAVIDGSLNYLKVTQYLMCKQTNKHKNGPKAILV